MLKAADMTVQSTQLLHLAEETSDLAQDGGLSKDTTDNVWDAKFNKIKNLLDPTDPGDAVTLNYITKNQDSLLTQLRNTGAAQNSSIVSTGDSQNARLTSTGDTQNTRLNTTGDTQDKRLNDLGQKYVDLMTTLKDTATTKANEATNSAELSKKWAMSSSSPDGVSGNKSSKTWAEGAKIDARRSAASASASQSSANDSSASATQSANSASASKSSANASASSASAASSSASDASTSASKAKTSETNAANSAKAAKQSEENAKTWDPTSYLSKTDAATTYLAKTDASRTYAKKEYVDAQQEITVTPLSLNSTYVKELLEDAPVYIKVGHMVQIIIHALLCRNIDSTYTYYVIATNLPIPVKEVSVPWMIDGQASESGARIRSNGALVLDIRNILPGDCLIHSITLTYFTNS